MTKKLIENSIEPRQEKTAVFSLRALSKRFYGQPEVTALDEVSLEIYPSQCLGIIGLSGAGKSTLLRCLNGLETASGGELFFKGEAFSSFDKKSLRNLRSKIAMIFQQFNLLAQSTALENVQLPLSLRGVGRNEAKTRAKEALAWVGLENLATRYPSQLSGGEQQRVAIARALAIRPEALLCDEPTSALDPSTTESILSLIARANRELGITVILITHQMDVVERICDRVVVMEDAKIVEEGTVEEVFYNPQSDLAKKMIFPGGSLLDDAPEREILRLVFDGTRADKPFIAEMTLACGSPVNILSANSRLINGNTTGQMLIELPDSQAARAAVLKYLDDHKLRYHLERSKK